MILHHFTSTTHLPLIVQSGWLRPSESNISATVERAGPSVVWMLDTPTVDHPHGLDGSAADKTEVRFTVDVPGILWHEWVWSHQMAPSWREAFVQAGGGSEAADHWYVWPGPLMRRRWREVALRQPDSTYSPLPAAEWQS